MRVVAAFVATATFFVRFCFLLASLGAVHIIVAADVAADVAVAIAIAADVAVAVAVTGHGCW